MDNGDEKTSNRIEVRVGENICHGIASLSGCNYKHASVRTVADRPIICMLMCVLQGFCPQYTRRHGSHHGVMIRHGLTNNCPHHKARKRIYMATNFDFSNENISCYK